MVLGEWYRKSADEVLRMLNATSNGLTDEEVNARRSQYGYNELKEEKQKSILLIFLEQFKDFLVIILIAAAVISAFMGEVESTFVILVVIIINGILGTAQHMKAEQSLKSLKKLSAPTAKVLRNGQTVEIPSKEIIVGDILYLDAGDFVSADGRIVESYSLQVNESSLTGESLSVDKISEKIDDKNITIGDQKNMVFSGSFVTNGRAVIVVTDIGMETEIGKIAKLMGSAKEKKTPLQVSLDQFGKKLAIGILIIAVIIFALDMFRGREWLDSLMFAIALAVAAIPEALSSIVTIVLAFGTQKMAKENAIMRKLHAVESLGSISVICSDKTGTLTQNKMTVQQVFVGNEIKEQNSLNMNQPLERKFVLMALLCNDAVTEEKKEIGDPTEIALVQFGEYYGIDELVARKKYLRIGEVPFDSDRKLMSTVNEVDGEPKMITKGALDVLLDRVSKIETKEGIIDFTYEHRKAIEKANHHFSSNGLRVLGFAYKDIGKGEIITTNDEYDFIFVGLVAMMDPPREESASAVASCIRAGIKPVMITGDHKITASAIAKQIGILKDEKEAMEGHELEKMSDEELVQMVENISVYARVSPEHKIRIVKAWQEKGNIVAMTGDGVNDGPALKQADIGIAMGITGTEVAKDASAMILTDDNFSTIVKAIANGRSIYANIKNSIRFLLAGNTAGILSVLFASLGGFPVPFAPVHLLFINLVTDSLPAIAIGLEPQDESLMKENPRDIKEGVLTKGFLIRLIIEGFLLAAVTITAFLLGLSTGDAFVASTMAFATLCMTRLFHSFNARRKHSLFTIGLVSNMYVVGSVVAGMILLHIVLLVDPLEAIFEIASLTSAQMYTVYGLSLLPLILIQLYKIIFIKK